MYVQIFVVHNFRGFLGFLAIRENYAGKIIEHRILETLHRKKCFHDIIENSNPQKLCTSKIWTYMYMVVRCHYTLQLPE